MLRFWYLKINIYVFIYIFFVVNFCLAGKVVSLMCCRQKISLFTNFGSFLFSHNMRRFLRFSHTRTHTRARADSNTHAHTHREIAAWPFIIFALLKFQSRVDDDGDGDIKQRQQREAVPGTRPSRRGSHKQKARCPGEDTKQQDSQKPQKEESQENKRKNQKTSPCTKRRTCK